MKALFNRKILAAAAVAAFLMPAVASAHTIAIGWSKGAAAGSVNLFLGSYHTDNIGDGPNVEGFAHLTGPGSYDTLSAFTTSYTTGVLPSNLAAENVQLYSSYSLSSMKSWEAVTVSGLMTAGTYVFSYSNVAGGSQHWSPYSTTTSFVLAEGDIDGGGTSVSDVPEPASLGLLALGLLGLGYSRRRG